MADDDIVVKIGADTSDLDARMARAQQMMRQGFTPLPQGLGGPPQSLLELATEKAKTQTTGERDAAVRKYAQAAKEATGATNQLSEAQDGLAQATDRTASAFERMVERMMMRLGIIYVIHEAIKLIAEALTESSAYETATVRWETLTRGVEGYGASLEDIKRISDETGISRQDLMGVEGEWKKIGVSTDVAGASLKNISEYAKILGTDVNTVAEEFGRVELKRGSIKDMQDLAYATQNTSLQRLVNDLAEAQRMAPILAQQMAEIDRQINRQADDQDRATMRAFEDAERLRNAQLGVAQAMGLAGKALHEYLYGGRTGGPAGQAIDRIKAEMAAGEAQLISEGNPTVKQMHEMGMKGREIYQVLMQAAQRYHEHVRINLQRQEEDEKRVREQKQEDARTDVRLTAAQDLLGAESAVAQAIKEGQGAQAGAAAALQTTEGMWDKIRQHVRDMVDDAQPLNNAIKGWATLVQGFVDSFRKADTGKMLSDAQGINTAIQGWNKGLDEFGNKLGKIVQSFPDLMAGMNKMLGDPAAKLAPGASPSGAPTQGTGFDWGKLSPFYNPSQKLAPDDSSKKQDDANKKQDETNKTLSMIHDVLQNAFA